MKLERLIQEVILGGNVEKIAAALGRSTGLVYRWANPNDEAAMPLLALPAIVECTGDVKIIRHLAHGAGCSLLRLPKRLPKFGPRTVMSLNKELHKTMNTVMEYGDGMADRDEVDAAIMGAVEQLLYVRRQVIGGAELPFDTLQGELSLKA